MVIAKFEISRYFVNNTYLKLAGTYNAEYEIRVRDLNSELANKNKILEDLQSKVQKTPPEIIKLKEELSEVKR